MSENDKIIEAFEKEHNLRLKAEAQRDKLLDACKDALKLIGDTDKDATLANLVKDKLKAADAAAKEG